MLECAACGKKTKQIPFPKAHGLWTCTHCGCIQGRTYLGDSYLAVSPTEWVDGGNEDPHYTVPYDIETLGSTGLGRRHGWCSTRQLDRLGACRIVQTG